MATTTVIKEGDIEAGNNVGLLYPNMTDNPLLRRAFIRKVYTILSVQLLLTVGLAATVMFIRPIPLFVLQTTPGFVVFIVSLIIPTILRVLQLCLKNHPVNLFVLPLFTISVSIAMGLLCSLFCSLSKGMTVLEAGTVASVVVVSLTHLTFWAAKRGHDYEFLGPFLCTSNWVLVVFLLIQIFIHMGRFGLMISSLIATILSSGFMIYDTDNLIKRFNYDECIFAAGSLYLAIFYLVVALLNVGNNANI